MYRKSKGASIKDIANKAGVSISTVSKVLNKRQYNISKKTQEKVQRAIKEFGYRPNIIARSLRTKRTNTLGIIIPDISIAFYAHIVKEILDIARKRGYTSILGCSFYNTNEEEFQVNSLLDQYVEGIIFLGGFDNDKLIESVFKQRVHLVAVDRDISNPEIYSVQFDNKLLTEQAVDYLCKYGHREIGYVTFSFKNHTIVKNRYLGYCDALKKNKIEYDSQFVVIDDSIRLDLADGTYTIAQKYLKKGKLPTAFLTMGDDIACGLAKALMTAGYRIPQDISIISIGNSIMNKYMQPPITTVEVPEKQMGSVAVNLLLDRIEGREIENKRIILPPKRIAERGSVEPLKRDVY